MEKKKIVTVWKIVLPLLVVVIAGILLVIYKLTGNDASETQNVNAKRFVGIDVDNIDYSAQYIRTDGGYDEIGWCPAVKIIRSVSELNDYYNAKKDTYNLSRHEEIHGDETIGFPNACDKYDDAYFENQILVMVLLKEGSGSFRHNVNMVGMTEIDGKKRMIIDIENIHDPNLACTADLAMWHVLVEPEQGVDVENESDITVFYDGMNETDKFLPDEEPILTKAPDDFSFSFTWGHHGVNYYDSEKGKLVKTSDTTYPKDYVTTYKLTEAQLARIYHLLCRQRNMFWYPEEYNPNENLAADPSMDLVLSIHTKTEQRTISATGIAATYESDNEEGQFFLNLCKYIQDMLTETEEWKALPDVCSSVTEKPVIYFYPEQKTDVSVRLILDGDITCTYPTYKDGWRVTAESDGTLTDANGQIYSYLYREGTSFHFKLIFTPTWQS